MTTTTSGTTNKSTALDFNVIAVSCLAIGDHEGCVSQLENSLKAFRESMYHAESQRQEDEMDDTTDTGATIQLQTFAIPDRNSPSSMSSASQFAGGNVLRMFHKAFVAVGDSTGENEANDDIVPAIILYNMGLSFHLDAIRTGSSAGMRRAYEFYRHSMTLLSNNQVDTSLYRPLVAALASNMAHISALFYHDIDSRRSMMILKNVVMDVGPDDVDWQEDELDIFTMNYLFYSEYHHMAMAAAA